MNKIDMREWTSALEEMIDNKLSKWIKRNPIQNGESILLGWQFEQTCMSLFVFWEDGKESVNLQCIGPRVSHSYFWNGLTDKTFNQVADRVGNLAQIVMHPPIDPLDRLS